MKPIITFLQFIDTFKPVFNHNVAEQFPDQTPETRCEAQGRLYKATGEDFKYVKTQPQENVWTFTVPKGHDEEEGECHILIKGFHPKHNVGFIITEVPWDENSPDVLY